MAELIVHHHPAEKDVAASVSVSFIARPGVQAMTRTVPFDFTLTPEERRDIQWYLESYLLLPTGEFKIRAGRIEAMMEAKGAELFKAVFGVTETYALYGNVVNTLPDTRIVIHCDAADTEGIALPWELMRDPQREPFGVLFAARPRLCSQSARP